MPATQIESEEQSGTGSRLSRAREKAGISRPELAKILGISYQRMTDIETDRKPSSLELVIRICEAMGADPHDIDSRLASTRSRRSK